MDTCAQEQAARNLLITLYDGKLEGHHIRRIKCPRCDKREAWCETDRPFVVLCPRMKKCGAETHLKDIHPEIFEFKASRDDLSGDALVEEYIEFRGTNFSKEFGHKIFHKSLTRDGEILDVVCYKLENDEYAGRIIQKVEGGKSHFEPGSSPAETVYAPKKLDYNESLMIVEGPNDACSCFMAGKQAVSVLSCNYKPEKNLWLAQHAKKFPSLILAFDADDAGLRGIENYIRYCEEHSIQYEIYLPPQSCDWNDHDIDWERSRERGLQYFISRPVTESPTMRREMILPQMRDWLTQAQKAFEVPLEYLVLPATVAYSGAIGKQVWASPWAGWKEAVPLWGFSVGHNGSLKSASMEYALSPLRKIQNQRDLTSDEIDEIEFLRFLVSKSKYAPKIDAATIEGLKKFKEIQKERLRRIAEIEGHKESFILESFTTAALTDRLSRCDRTQLAFYDELAVMFNDFDSEHGRNGRELAIKSWTIPEESRRDLKGEGEVILKRPSTCIYGLFQPNTFLKHIGDTYNGDGFAERFQLVSLPVEPMPEKYDVDSPPPISEELIEKADKLYKQAYYLSNSIIFGENASFNIENEISGRRVISFSKQAAKLFAEKHHQWKLKRRAAIRAGRSYLMGAYGKFSRVMISLATMHYIARRSEYLSADAEISITDLRFAFEWENFLEQTYMLIDQKISKKK